MKMNKYECGMGWMWVGLMNVGGARLESGEVD